MKLLNDFCLLMNLSQLFTTFWVPLAVVIGEPTNYSILESSFAESDKESRSEVVSTGTKRYSTPSSSKSPSKKLKYIDDSLDEEIERCKKGIYKKAITSMLP